jgi:hypothetical protein
MLCFDGFNKKEKSVFEPTESNFDLYFSNAVILAKLHPYTTFVFIFA